MSKTAIRIGPADNGRRMNLEDFESAEVQEGYLYELSRAMITVSDVPNRIHFLIVAAIRDLLQAYKAMLPDRIQFIASGNECKLLISNLESQRHPDLSLYLTFAPEIDDETLWTVWLPEIVIEVVSASSRQRDYHEKPEEYLRIGVKEYWIVDPDRQVLIVMRRLRGRWVETSVKSPEVYQSRLLPGFEFEIDAVFQMAGLT